MDKIEFSLNIPLNRVSFVQWISVNENMPEANYGTVLVVCTDGSVDAASFIRVEHIHNGPIKERFYEIGSSDPSVLDVLYWADLPEPPALAKQQVTIINNAIAQNESLTSAEL